MKSIQSGVLGGGGAHEREVLVGDLIHLKYALEWDDKTLVSFSSLLLPVYKVGS